MQQYGIYGSVVVAFITGIAMQNVYYAIYISTAVFIILLLVE